MLDRCRDQMIPVPPVRPCTADQREIITLRSAGCEDELFCIYLQQPGYRFFCIPYIVLCLHSFFVHGRRIAVILAHHFVYKFSHIRIAHGCGRIVKINFHIHIPLLLFLFINYDVRFPNDTSIWTAWSGPPSPYGESVSRE